jgi:photosystem II stability/assembly factor-like uncharacterized protein
MGERYAASRGLGRWQVGRHARRRALVQVLFAGALLSAGCASAGAQPSAGSRAARPSAAAVPAGASLVDAGGGVAWLMNGARVLRTIDGGITWKAVYPSRSAPGSSQSLGATWFSGRDDAWVEQVRLPGVSHPGSTVLWRTTDAGAHWKRAVAPFRPPLTGLELPFDAISMAGGRVGFALTTVLVDMGKPDEYRAESLWHTRDGGLHWRRVARARVPGDGLRLPGAYADDQSDPFALVAESRRVAWLAQTAGASTLWRTTDAGVSWVRIRIPGATGGRLLGAPMLSGGRGVLAIAQPRGRLVVDVSADDGSSWHRASMLHTGSIAPPAGFDAVSSDVWVLPSSAGLFTTVDGGQHWSLSRSGLSLGYVTRTAFATPRSGIAVPTELVPDGALVTSDGGAHWSSGPFPAINPSSRPASSSLVPSLAPALNTASDGSSLFINPGRAGSWPTTLAPLSGVASLSFSDQHDGWALGSAQLFATSDGGSTWTPRVEPPQGPLVNAELIDPQHGVGVVCRPAGAYGQQGAEALSTSDGGQTWKPLRLPAGPESLSCDGTGSADVCFTTAASGWALLTDSLDGTAELVHTTDGGRSWSPSLRLSRVGSAASVTCSGSTVSVSAGGQMLGMTGGTPTAVFVSGDGGGQWLDALVSGPGTPKAAGIAPATSVANAQIADVALGQNGEIAALTVCLLCQLPAHPLGTFGVEVSSDEGRHWTVEATPSRPLPYVGPGIAGEWAVAFPGPSALAILAPSSTGHGRLTLIESADLGRTWQTATTLP